MLDNAEHICNNMVNRKMRFCPNREFWSNLGQKNPRILAILDC